MDPKELSLELRRIADSIDAEEKPNREVIASRIRTAVEELTPGDKSEITPLSSVVAILRAARMLHHTHHWIMSGPQFYGDHLLLQRLYEGIDPDGVGERTVGFNGSVCAKQQANAIVNLINQFETESKDPESLLNSSLEMENAVISTIDQARAQLEQAGQLSNGTDNLLQGIADEHEVFVYLLQQRLK